MKRPKRPDPKFLIEKTTKDKRGGWYYSLSDDDKCYIEQTVALAAEEIRPPWRKIAAELQKIIEIDANISTIESKLRTMASYKSYSSS